MAPTGTKGADASFEALRVLTSCNLKELHLKRADGTRTLDSLFATCRAAGLIPPGTPDGSPRERYLAVFDAALNGGVGLWILDYVDVVCADRHLTSNDPLEAYLLDGGFVKAWAHSRLQRAEIAIEGALENDTNFHTFQSSQLQQQLAQVHVIVSVLRSLDRIRSVAAGSVGATPVVASAAATATGTSAVHDRLSVKAELHLAILLEQTLQVMGWCARHRLVGPGSNPGRFATSQEWRRVVGRRAELAKPRQPFLRLLTKSLSPEPTYPENSKAHMLKSILLSVRNVDPATWANKLALLTYIMMDAGLLDESGSGSGSCCGPRLEEALEDLRRTFQLSAGDVGVWQCYYLLDCATPGSHESEDPYLARVCALLPSYVTENTPFAFIEALLALRRPDIALAVDRGQFRWGAGGNATMTSAATGAVAAFESSASGPGSRRSCCCSLDQAMKLMEIRLRCGLMMEAFMLMRQHTSDLVARGEREEVLREQTKALLRHLAEWAADTDAKAAADKAANGSWLNRLAELPLNAMEEFVLMEWLVEHIHQQPTRIFVPLFFLQRGRIPEAVSAWRIYELATAKDGGESTPLSRLLDASLDAEVQASLPMPLRNVDVAVPSAAEPATEAKLLDLAPGQGAVSILAGLKTYLEVNQVEAHLSFHGTEPPPLVTRVVQLPTNSPLVVVETAPTLGDGTAGAASEGAGGTCGGGGGDSLAQAIGQAPKPQQSQLQPPFAAMPILMPAKAPFRTPPATPGLDAPGIHRPSQPTVGSGGGGPLFNIGPGTFAAGWPLPLPPLHHVEPAGMVAAAPVDARTGRKLKRAKTDNWM